jgi:hypothetical protein
MEIAQPAKERTLHECGGKDLEAQLRFCEKVSIFRCQHLKRPICRLKTLLTTGEV